MATYLLLRNNKESGPYSLSELQTKGLKAYDLVWVEGKSAAWRYPSEVEELKSFAPIVEEQPYDRFYKKTSDQKQTAESVVVPPVQEKEIVTVVPQKQPVVVSLNKKNVYVTMPAGQTFVAVKNDPAPEEIKNKDFVQKPFVNKTIDRKQEDEISPKPGTKTSLVSAASFISTDVESVPDFPDQVKKASQNSNKKNLPDISAYKKPAVMLLATIMLLAMGIFIGIWINQRGSNSTKQGIAIPQNVADAQHLTGGQQPSAVEANQLKKNIPVSDSVATIVSANSLPVTENRTAVNIDKKKEKAQKEKIADTVAGNASKPAMDSSYISVAHREATHRGEGAEEKPAPKINIADLVSLSANKYAVGAFGGISDLQLTVKNQSAYPLDLVVVEVQYVQANKKIFKTENLYFHNVGANAALMQEAPKSPRGIKVEYKLTIVNSKQSGIAYSGI